MKKSTTNASKVNWGGNRPNAGRKPSGKKAKQIYVTDEEYQKIKTYLDTLRAE